MAVDAPHTKSVETTNGNGDPGAKWRLPLDPIRKQTVPAITLFQEAEQALVATEVVDEPVAPAPLAAVAALELVADDAEAVIEESLEFEAPDVTTRYAVAQLTELNQKVTELTEFTTDRTEAALEKVHAELRRITSMREVDLTEQAAGIFAAVQAGADALGSFATVVQEVTDDLRTILHDSLAAIGGTEGLAAWVAESATELTDIREDFASSLAKIERDLSILRKNSREAAAAPASVTINDDQLTFLVEAVTEAVVSALRPNPTLRRR